MSEIQLPDKPSELIRLALSDLRKCEADPRYSIDMWAWHAPFLNDRCYVCLAGAVMAKSINASITDELAPSDFDGEISTKLNALDCFRLGDIAGGLDKLGIDTLNLPEAIEPDIEIADHYSNPTQFHADMESLAAMLEKHNL